MQRSLSNSNSPLTRTTLQADFDSMWRGSALFSVAAGHRLDVLRGEVEERMAERATRQRTAAQPPHSESAAGIADLRRQLRKPAAAPFERACQGFFADSDRSQAPHHNVSRLVAPLLGAGRLTTFSDLRQPRRSANFVVRVASAVGAEQIQPDDCNACRSRYANYKVRATPLASSEL